jgi:hypothetical protein
MTLAECKKMAIKLLKPFFSGNAQKNLSLINVWHRPYTRVAKGGSGQLSLPKWARNPSVVAHETAHMLLHKKGYNNNIKNAHGPEFVWALTSFLARLHKMPVGRIRAHARKSKVKIKSADWYGE